MRVLLTKMHGALNDFVIVDQRIARLCDLSGFARWACDRHAGIGADGLLVIESSDRADARMRTINADGSEAEMCGNGIRCAARWLDEAANRNAVTLETNSGIVRAEILTRGAEYLVRVAMGRPQIAPIALGRLDSALVDIGNRHVVISVDRIAGLDLEQLVATVANEPTFPHEANVHLVQRDDEHIIRAVHWERGVGLTMACGTGAVACAAVAVWKAIASSPVSVLVPGGRLTVEWAQDGEVYLTGPAVRVFATEANVEFETLS